MEFKFDFFTRPKFPRRIIFLLCVLLKLFELFELGIATSVFLFQLIVVIVPVDIFRSHTLKIIEVGITIVQVFLHFDVVL